MKHKIMWVILIFLLPACGTTQPTVTPSPIPDTPTASRVPTRTIIPTRTPRPTPKPKPTLDLDSVSFEVNYSYRNPIEMILNSLYVDMSPNGELFVDRSITLSIINTDGVVFLEIHPTIGWEIFSGNYWTEVRWSLDSRYVFFSMVPAHACYFCDGLGYWKLDVVTGEYIEILPIQSHSMEYFRKSIELSPSQTKIAYVSLKQQPLRVYILDIENGTIKDFPINSEFKMAGNIIWSPDESKVIYSSSKDEYIEIDGDNKFYFYLLDLDTGKQRLLVETVERLYIRTWNKNNIIEFKDGCEINYFDIALSMFSANATATPIPSNLTSVDKCHPTPTPTP